MNAKQLSRVKDLVLHKTTIRHWDEIEETNVTVSRFRDAVALDNIFLNDVRLLNRAPIEVINYKLQQVGLDLANQIYVDNGTRYEFLLSDYDSAKRKYKSLVTQGKKCSIRVFVGTPYPPSLDENELDDIDEEFLDEGGDGDIADI